MVSVSRRAGLPHLGQVALTNSGLLASGDWPVPVISTSSGRSTGNSSSGTATTPHELQWITGIGVPQYRCREIPQSLMRNVTALSPNSSRFALAVIRERASELVSPE